nr:hypothetical protein [Tanacetum cinerariifolium]
MKEHETIVEKVVKDPFVTDSGIESLGNVDLDQMMKDQKGDDDEITFMGNSTFDQGMEEVKSDVESMPDDEIVSIYEEDNDEDDSDRELFMADEVVVGNIIDELITEANKEDTNVFATTTNEEAKRLADLKAKREKLDKELRTLTPAQLRAQKEELAKIEAKQTQHMNKMRDGYDYCIDFKDDPLPITKFNYRVSKASKIDDMRITGNNQALNLKIYDKFIFKMLGFNEWLELHALASRGQVLLMIIY